MSNPHSHASPSADRRARSVSRFLPGVVHDVRNGVVPLRVGLELAGEVRELPDQHVLLAGLDTAEARLANLSRFARSSFGEGAVELGAWGQSLEWLTRTVAAQHGIGLLVEVPEGIVAVEAAWDVLSRFAVLVSEHLVDGAGFVRVRARAERARIVFTLVLGSAADLDTCDWRVRRTARALVLRTACARLGGDADVVRVNRRSSVLVLEPADPLGALTAAVLADAGHLVEGASTWDLALVDSRCESTEAERLRDLRAQGVPIAYLGDGGLARPFDARQLLSFVDEQLGRIGT